MLAGVWFFLAHAAAAVGVVFFLRRVAEIFCALLARAFLAVGFARFEGIMGQGDLFSFRGEDDVVDGMVGIGEGAAAEIDFARAEDAVEGVGGLEIDALIVERVDDNGIVELEGGAVFREDEGQRLMGAGWIAPRLDLGEGGANFCVVVAEEGSFEGG